MRYAATAANGMYVCFADFFHLPPPCPSQRVPVHVACHRCERASPPQLGHERSAPQGLHCRRPPPRRSICFRSPRGPEPWSRQGATSR
eukprot:6917788-Pyramimonas_sp.AAC.1